MTPDDAKRLAEIEQRANAATEGPWTSPKCDPGMVPGLGDAITTRDDSMVIGATSYDEEGLLFGKQKDLDFAAAARMDVPWLIEKLREAEAHVERLKGDAFLTSLGVQRRDAKVTT